MCAPSNLGIRRIEAYGQRKNLMVISGGIFSIALRISLAAFASRFVSMFIPTAHSPHRM
jgi:hypothetical protein